jgi:hypothetical protein
MFPELAEVDTNKYTRGIEVPIYEPKHQKPHILELCNRMKAKELLTAIEASNVTQDEKDFLIEASKRHNIFNYEKIADYYAHSNNEMRKLMEASALVIIDFEQAIEQGYVKLCEEIKEQYMTDYAT